MISQWDNVVKWLEHVLTQRDRFENDSAHYEIEMRLGTCVVATGRTSDRLRRYSKSMAGVDRAFVAAVDEMRWRATFACLAARDDILTVSAPECSIHERVEAAPAIRFEYTPDDTRGQWVHKKTAVAITRDVVVDSDSDSESESQGGGWPRNRPWCDVRLAVAKESVLDTQTPPAPTTTDHWSRPDTRRQRRRRSLVFTWARDWRVDFTICDVESHLNARDVERVRQHEIEIEHVAAANATRKSRSSIAQYGARVLITVMNACGATDGDFDALVRDRMRRQQLKHVDPDKKNAT